MSSQIASPCYCSQHYHYQEPSNGSSSPHYHYPHLPLLPASLTPTTRNDNDEMQISGETHVSVTVHHHQQQQQQQQQPPYQILDRHEENEMNSCDCKHGDDHQSGCNSSRLASADESHSQSHSRAEVNADGTWKPKRYNKNHHHRQSDPTKIRNAAGQKRGVVVNDGNSSRIEVYSDAGDSGVKVTDCATSEEDKGPPLPPRPPPRGMPFSMKAPHSSGIKKYIVWCLICGGFSCLLGIMFLGVYFLLRSYTSTIGYFETVPTYVPAVLLIVTGSSIMGMARRRNRYNYLIKLSGLLGLISALTCALATVTTTVLHMSRLQSLKECEYTPKTRTCTCYSEIIGPQMVRFDEEGVKLVVDSTNDCGVVHGSIYSCLRAIFGLSVAGVIVSVFCCLLVYQLLSHERKKKYWEQLDLRCRSLYASQQAQLSHTRSNASPMMNVQQANGCSCCEQCHAHRHNALQPSYPWETGVDSRFWESASHPPGNFYSPTPGGDQLPSNRQNGWRWPRMPWKRQTITSSDSQYGFSPGADNVEQIPAEVPQNNFMPYSVWGPPPPYSDPNSPARRGAHCAHFHPVHHCRTNGAAMQLHQRPDCPQHNRSHVRPSPDVAAPPQTEPRAPADIFKTRNNYENTQSDSDSSKDRFSKTTTPNRKLKKRGEFPPDAEGSAPTQLSNKNGLENPAYQNGESAAEPTESEIYFADGSSCCNNSLRNDSYALKLPLAKPTPDVARQSMCSVDSGERTDFTDLSPATPCASFAAHISHKDPYQNGHDAQYEAIDEADRPS